MSDQDDEHEDEAGQPRGEPAPARDADGDDADGDDADGDDAAGGGGRPILPASDEQPIVFLSESGDFDRVPANGPAGNGHDVPSWPPADALEPEEPKRRRPRGEAFDPIARFPLVAPEVLLPEPDLPAEPVDPSAAAPALELRTPPEELETFARARVEAWARAGQPARARAVQDAAELALAALRRAMGTSRGTS